MPAHATSQSPIATTQDLTLYESSFQNFGFHAQGRYWTFYEDTSVNCEGMGGCLFYTSSLDGISWSTPVNVGIHVTDSDWSIVTNSTHAFYVRYDENWFDSFCNRALLLGVGEVSSNGNIAWGPEQTVKSADPALRFPNDVIRVDGNNQVWVGYQQHECNGLGLQTPHVIHSSLTNYGQWIGDTTLSTVHSNNWDIDIAVLPQGSIFAAYWINGMDLHGALFNGTAWGPDEQISSPSDSVDVNSFVFASGNTVYAIWYDTNTQLLHSATRFSATQWSINTIGTGEAKSANSLGRYSLPITATFDPTKAEFYVFWYNATNRVIDEWSGSGNTWTKTPGVFTTASATGEYTITSFYQSALVGGNYSFGVMWVDQPSSPYNLNFRNVTVSSQSLGGGTGQYFDHVVTIIMENQGTQNICGGNPPPCNGSSSPYLSALANRYGIGSQYTSVNPGGSQPNYVGLISGSTFNCTEASCPAIPAQNLADRLETAGLSWKAYMENQAMVSGCDMVTTPLYEWQHNPFVAFSDIRNNPSRCSNIVLANPNGCSVTDCVLINDLNSASAPNFMWLTPNDCNNMHGAPTNNTCPASISMGDNYLSNLVPNILNSTTFKTQRSALFVVFDEGTNYCPLNGAHEDCVYAVWAGPEAKNNFATSNYYNHYSFTRTVESNWNLPSLGTNDTTATPMTEFFTSTPPCPLTVGFSYSPTSPVTGQQITFTASACGGTPPYRFGWDFGDSSTGVGVTVTHAYQTKGSYTTTVTVVDAKNQTATASQTISVVNPPPPPPLTATFSLSPASPETGQQAVFTGSASGGIAPYTFAWTFGDGGVAGGNPVTHTYSSSGSFSVSLAATDANGTTASYSQVVSVAIAPAGSFTFAPVSPEANSPVTFTASATNGVGPFTFSWAFGDGASATGNPVNHTYATSENFTVSMTATDGNGATAASSQTLTVANGLVVTFTMSPSSPEATGAESFTASTLGGVGAVSIIWSFGDGSTSTANPTTHTYATSGPYTLSVTATDSNGVQTTSSQILSVAAALTASFTVGPSSPDAGQSVSFTGSPSGGVPPYSYSWTFGDSGIGSGPAASHTYQTAGAYTVTLTVTDANGQVSQATQTITVNPPLSASFSNSPNPTIVLPVQFTGSATGGVQPYSYSWDFGDGSTGNGASVSHSYLLPGSYTVKLTVTDATGQTVTTSATITVSLPLLSPPLLGL